MSGVQITLRGNSADDADMTDEAPASGGRPRVVITTKSGAAAAAAASSSSGTGRRQIKMKGRGFKGQFEEAENQDRYAGKGGEFESLEEEGGEDAQKSVEGWLVIVTGLHEETNEDELYELFADHGEIKQLHLNLDRRTGYVKGYALIEYGGYKEAQAAITTLNGHLMHDKTLTVDWAFKPSGNGRGGGRRARQSGGGGGGRGATYSSGGRGPVSRE